MSAGDPPEVGIGAAPVAGRDDRRHPEWTDEELLVAVRADDAEAYAELWSRSAEQARRFARTLVPADDVDDVVSEAFAKMLQALQNDRGPNDNPIRYLMVAVRTTAYTLHAKRSRSEEAASRFATEDSTSMVLSIDGDERLLDAFASLPNRWRSVLWWAEVEGLSPAEIGERLDLNPQAASALAYRARKALRAAYEDLAAEHRD